MDSFRDLFLIFVLVSWLVLTVLLQFTGSRVSVSLSTLDLCSLLPRWAFFAPTPGSFDVHLIYQDVVSNSSHHQWSEVHSSSRRRKKWAFLFNPWKVHNKAIFDSAQLLLQIRHKRSIRAGKDDRLIIFSLPYMTLLNVVMNQANVPSSYSRRFALVHTDGFGKNKSLVPVFISEFHRIK